MAINAVFRADFAQFQTAVTQAETKLKAFQTDASKVETSLNRMGDAFSGRKVISEATLAVKAIQDIGGVTKLTESEQKKLNATLTEAVAKYTVLGKEAPKALTDMQKATAQTEKSTGGLSSTLSTMGQTILSTAAGFFTAQVAFNAVKGAVGALVDELKTITVHGAAVADVADNFDHLTEQSGRLGASLIGELREGTHRTITDFDLMKLATQDLAVGLNLTDNQFGLLAKGAFALAQATGGDVKTALDTMNDAMRTGRTRSLALLTGKIDLEKAEMAFAKSLGTTRDQLSEEGKLEAARIAILNSVGTAIDRLGVQTDGLDERIAQAQTTWANFQDELGRTVATSPVIASALDSIAGALTATFGSEKQTLVRTIASLIDDAAIALVEFAKLAVSSAGFIIKEYHAVNKLFGNTAQIVDGLRLAFLYFQQSAMLASGDLANWKKLDDQIGKLLQTMLDRGKALQEETRAQGNVDRVTAEYSKTLDDVITRMKTARTESAGLGGQTAATAGALGQVGTAGHAAAAGVGSATGAFVTGKQAIADAAKQAKEFAADYIRLTKAMEGDWQKILSANWEAAAASIKRNAESARLELEKFLGVFKQIGQALPTDFPLARAFDQLPMKSIEAALAAQEGMLAVFSEVGQQIPDAITPPSSMVKITNAFTSVFSELPNILMRAFEGGGGGLGAAKSAGTLFGATLSKNIFGTPEMKNSITSVFGATLGGAFNALLPGIGALAGPLIGAIAGLFDGVFGPSKEELEGRGIAAQFRAQLEGMLTDVQKLEAGGEKWKESIIAVRDAYLAAGLSEQDALSIMDKLWKAEKQGGDAVKKVIEEIQRTMRGGLKPAIEATTTATEVWRDTIVGAAEGGQVAIAGIGDRWLEVKTILEDGVTIPIGFESSGGGDGKTSTSTGDRSGYLTPEEARELGKAWRPKSEFDWSDAVYRAVRDEDASELNKLAEENSFQRGTAGRYLNFGAGTPVMLHGQERIMTRGEATAEGGGSDSAKLDKILRALLDLPRAIATPMKTALIEAGYRY